jgi:regulator of RNase E activity RraA
MRDVTRVVHHSIEGRGLAENVTMVGRAYTCEGPDIYLNALECIQPGEVFVHGGCNDTDAVFSPGWTHAYLKPRGAVGVVVDGGVYKSYQCKDAAVPMFTKFVSPSPAINRKETGELLYDSRFMVQLFIDFSAQ